MKAHPLEVAFVALLALMAFSSAAWTPPRLFLVNESRSVPRGLYLRQPAAKPAVGDLVAVRPPPLARDYLRGLGRPPEDPLLKHVGAAPGAQVCVTGDRVEIPRGVVFRLRTDRQDRALPRWRGCRRLGPDEVFLVGDSARSFDSRYFGPVRTEDLDGVYREILRW